jgi:hypothetical protein
MLSFVVAIVLQQTSTSLWKCESCKVEIENFAITIQNKVKCYSNDVGFHYLKCGFQGGQPNPLKDFLQLQ